jgi:hypothetical protein
LSQPRRSKPVVTPHGALTPESCGTPMPTPPTQNELLLLAEIRVLRQSNQAQRHALKELNKAIRFVLNTMGKPLHVKGMNKPARKMRKPQ